MNDTMGAPLPPDLELRPDVTQDALIQTLNEVANRLLFGRESIGDPKAPGEPTAFRSVVIVTGMVGLSAAHRLTPMAIGVMNSDESGHARSTWPLLAAKLRAIADDLESMHRRGGGEGS